MLSVAVRIQELRSKMNQTQLPTPQTYKHFFKYSRVPKRIVLISTFVLINNCLTKKLEKMANVITLDVWIFDGTVYNAAQTKQMPVDSIVNIYTSVSGGDYAVGAVNSLVYAQTEAGIKAYYCAETPDAIKTEANA